MLSQGIFESTVTVVSLGLKEREGREKFRRASSVADKNVEGERVTFYDSLNNRFS